MHNMTQTLLEIRDEKYDYFDFVDFLRFLFFRPSKNFSLHFFEPEAAFNVLR